DGHVVLVAQAGDIVQILVQIVGVGVVEKEDHINLVVGNAGADLLGAAVGMGHKQLDRQAGGLRHQTPGAAGGAHRVLGEDAAVSDAELHHQLLLCVVTHKSNVHGNPSFLMKGSADVQ